MSKYLVTCSCGNQVPVEVGQAGGRIACSCGSMVDVPPLRKLRHLPPAEVQEERAATQWSVRHGLLTVSLIATALLLGAAIWNWSTQPHVPTFDPVLRGRAVEETLKNITPAQAWEFWLNYRLQAESGFHVYEASNRAEIEQTIAHKQFSRRILWGLAGLCGAIAAAAAFWPRTAETGRKGDKETRRTG